MFSRREKNRVVAEGSNSLALLFANAVFYPVTTVNILAAFGVVAKRRQIPALDIIDDFEPTEHVYLIGNSALYPVTKVNTLAGVRAFASDVKLQLRLLLVVDAAFHILLQFEGCF